MTPRPLLHLLRASFDCSLAIEDLYDWSPARRELFFQGLRLCRGAVNNMRTEWSDDKILELLASLTGDDPLECDYEDRPIP